MGHVPERCAANGCESKTSSSDEWVRCQGSDDCLARMCPNHEDESRCCVCLLPACEQHMHTVGKERMCTKCLRDLTADGDEQVLEALASKIMDDVQRDMASQPEAEAWAGVAAAGRQPHWWLKIPADNDDTPEFMERWQRKGDASDNMPAFDNDSEGDVRF
jgi:hypothetical protein